MHTKSWIGYVKVAFGVSENGLKLSTQPVNIAGTMAGLDASLMHSSSAQVKKDFPNFNYFSPYEFRKPRDVFKITTTRSEDSYGVLYKTGMSHFKIQERNQKIHWNYKFDLDTQFKSEQVCDLIFLPDGSFLIQPPSRGHGVPVHSKSCKLLTYWDQEIVKQNVERVAKLLEVKGVETDPAEKLEMQEATKVHTVESNVKSELSKLVRQVEDGLEIARLNQGPVYEFIYESLQECRELLQNPVSTEQKLMVAMRKLRSRGSDVLKK